MTVGLAALVLVLLGLFVASLYNGLVRLRNGTENAFGSIDVQLKQRCDLIPKVVDAVRGYMGHEQAVLTKLTELRSRATAAGAGPSERMALDGQMAGLLHGLVARAEAYPDLKASQVVVVLQQSLNEVEAQIAAARRTYNAAVTAYNTAIETLPASLVAGRFGFTRRPLFEASTEERAVPRTASLAR
jgi:LemA protein